MTKTVKTTLFFLVALLVLSCAIMASLVFKNNVVKNENMALQKQSEQDKNYQIYLENAYEKSLLEVVDSMQNMQANLSKLHASNGKENQHFLITKIVSEAQTAESDIGNLPIDNEWLKRSAQFANVTSDFCNGLQQKISGQNQLSQNDRKTLKWLSSTSQTLANRLADISKRVGKDFLLLDGVLHEGKIGAIDNEFDEVDDVSFDYPKSIFDGPFSEAKTQKITLDLPAFSSEKAEQKVAKELEDFGVKTVKYVGEVKNKLDVFNFEVEFENEGKCYVQATQKGGVICYMSSCGCKGKPNSKQDAILLAEQFANKLGYDVKAVWVSKQNDGPAYVNLAPVVGGVVIYPDLIKVSVDDNGVCGFEGLNYLANHKNRVLDKMARDDKMAREKLADGMVVANSNLVLVPKHNQEILCFEFECQMDDEQYFVYINADTLDEVDIFKVIKGTEGYTVI